MKTNTVLIAMTFVLGSLMTLLLLGQMTQSVRAQDAGDGNIKGVSALTVQVAGAKQVLVVLKEVENMDKASGDQDFQKVTAMAVYDFQNTNGGQGRGKAVLIASRYLDYDLNLVYYNNERGEDTTYAWSKNTYKTVQKTLEGKK
jgi:hypothetical protein